MTMNTGLARALRRFAGGVAIMLAGLTGIHHRLFAEIQVPPADVDRIVVRSPEGRSHEITDPAEVAQIVRQIRSLLDGALPIEDRLFNPELRIWHAALHRGAEDLGGIGVHNQVIFTQGMLFGISTEEALDLHRLLGATESPASPAKGNRE